MTLASRIAHARELHGLSRRELSQRIGAGDVVVGQIERGAIPNPGSATIVALAAELDVSTDWLLLGTGRGPRRRRRAA